METQRIFLAIFLSLAILFGYQYFFIPAAPPPAADRVVSREAPPAGAKPDQVSAAVPVAALAVPQSAPALRPGRDIQVSTGLFSAVVSESGGTIKSFLLKGYREGLEANSGNKQLIETSATEGLPLDFSWGIEPGALPTVIYDAGVERLVVSENGEAGLTLRGRLPAGLEVTRTMRFHDRSYQVEMTVDLLNPTTSALQGAPYLTLVNRPFSKGSKSSQVSNVSAALLDGTLEEIKTDDLKKGNRTLTGRINWAAYEDNYFLCGIVPLTGEQHTAQFSLTEKDRVRTVLAGASDTILPGAHRQYRYMVYFGPKKLATLKEVGHGLDRSVDFGWFDVLAKPMLFMLNFFERYLGNYGVAIILVTVLIKIIFWPISQKGMKSMKTMQKIQPKMAKLREKYKDDKQMQQQEMIKLYQTYKVNPVGGCLPMLVQIPVFFALYRVLLQTIELRHAPFFLWITDLSAPDRLPIGFDLPYLGGIPVLTLLMGASMFLQQKMTPASGDPTQQKVMMFMPVIFTFMFLNFASGLVLYWFVNNLLSIGQQYLINRQTES